MRAVVVRQGGDSMVSGRISEGIWEAEARRLQAENEYLREQLRIAEARVGLFNWGMEQEQHRRRTAEARVNKRRRGIYQRVMELIGAAI